MKKLSFELTTQLKAEFETYLYNENQKNKACDELHNTDIDNPNYDSLEERIKVYDKKLIEQVQMASKGYNISIIDFVDRLNEYSENKPQK